jgi:hypothetical protein
MMIADGKGLPSWPFCCFLAAQEAAITQNFSQFAEIFRNSPKFIYIIRMRFNMRKIFVVFLVLLSTSVFGESPWDKIKGLENDLKKELGGIATDVGGVLTDVKDGVGSQLSGDTSKDTNKAGSQHIDIPAISSVTVISASKYTNQGIRLGKLPSG